MRSIMMNLREPITSLNGCESTLVGFVPVKETVQGQTVRDRTVRVFELIDRPVASRCYGWSHETDLGNQLCVAVLHQGPVDSPEKAVLVAIVQEHQGEAGSVLVFLDESGIPHPNDSTTNPVVVAVCIDQAITRSVGGQLFALKRRLGTPDIELKGVNLVTRRVFERRENEWELVESFFDLCRALPFTLFAVVMEHPRKMPHGYELDSQTYLPNEYRYLLQRIDQIAQEAGKMATLLFDGDGPSLLGGTLPKKFESFLYRSQEGRSFTNISDAPYFVDSRLTQGIQIADMAAYVCRIYQENNLYQCLPQGNRYLSAINPHFPYG